MKEDILKQTDHSEWAHPIVILLKSNGSVKICGDYRATVSGHTENGKYLLPRTKELHVKLSDAKFFTVFNLED